MTTIANGVDDDDNTRWLELDLDVPPPVVSRSAPILAVQAPVAPAAPVAAPLPVVALPNPFELPIRTASERAAIRAAAPAGARTRTTAESEREQARAAAAAERAAFSMRIAGALATGGDGCSFYWSGRSRDAQRIGARPRALLVEIAQACNVVLPRVLGEDTYAAQAVRGVITGRQAITTRSETARERDARGADRKGWIVSDSSGADGRSTGSLAVSVALRADGSLDCQAQLCQAQQGYEALADQISRDYRTQVESEIFQAGQISAWLDSVFASLGAFPYHGGWYCPAGHVALAARVCEMLSADWGSDWVGGDSVAPLPITSVGSLVQALSRNLRDDLSKIRDDFAAKRAEARGGEKPAVDISATVARTLLGRVADVATQIEGYRVFAGEGAIEVAEESIKALRAELEPIAEGRELELDGAGEQAKRGPGSVRGTANGGR